MLIDRNNPLVIPVENSNFPPRLRCQSINNLEMKIAVNKEVKIPIKRVVANPLIGPDPNKYNINAVSPVVILASNIEDNALLNPSLTAIETKKFCNNFFPSRSYRDGACKRLPFG